MTSQPPRHPAQREPLLWLQLLGLAAVPLEALLLFVVFAGADPGLFPGFERVLCWALGSLSAALLFWRLPPDLWSLLLLQVPLRGRRPEQLKLSALQSALPLRLLGAAGAALLLPLVWWADAHAGMAWSWSPFAASGRLVVLLVAVPLLTLMQWQWHQLVSALWMLTRSDGLISQTLPLTQADASELRLNLGLPLLLLPPLEWAPPSSTPIEPVEPVEPVEDLKTDEAAPTKEVEPARPAEPEPTSANPAEPARPAEPEAAEPEAIAAEPAEGQIAPEEPQSDAVAVSTAVDAAIAPEQEPEEQQSTDLDQEI